MIESVKIKKPVSFKFIRKLLEQIFCNTKWIHEEKEKKKSRLEIICQDEIKLDESLLDQQFKIDGYQFPPFRRDRDKKGGGKVAFVREGFIVNKIKEFEKNKSETIYLELFPIKNRLLCMYAGILMKQARKFSLTN